MVSMLDYIYEEQVALEKILEEFNFHFEELKDITHCLILATGSSYNASLAAKYYMESTAGIYVDIQEPFHFLHYGTMDPKFDLVIAVSQSGKSASTIYSIEKIKKTKRINTIALTSDIESPITKVVHTTFNLNMDIENVGFVTKGYSATVLNLMLLSLAIAFQSKKMTKNNMENYLTDLREVIGNVNQVIGKTKKFFDNAKDDLINNHRFIIIGYGPNWGTAKEAETKFTETIRKPSHGFELESYMHGPYLEANKTHHLFFIETEGDVSNRSQVLRAYMINHVKTCYVITTKASHEKNVLGLDVKVDEKISPLLLVIPFQYLAYQVASLQGINLDKRIFDDFDRVLQSKI